MIARPGPLQTAPDDQVLGVAVSTASTLLNHGKDRGHPRSLTAALEGQVRAPKVGNAGIVQPGISLSRLRKRAPEARPARSKAVKCATRAFADADRAAGLGSRSAPASGWWQAEWEAARGSENRTGPPSGQSPSSCDGIASPPRGLCGQDRYRQHGTGSGIDGGMNQRTGKGIVDVIPALATRLFVRVVPVARPRHSSKRSGIKKPRRCQEQSRQLDQERAETGQARRADRERLLQVPARPKALPRSLWQRPVGGKAAEAANERADTIPQGSHSGIRQGERLRFDCDLRSAEGLLA